MKILKSADGSAKKLSGPIRGAVVVDYFETGATLQLGTNGQVFTICGRDVYYPQLAAAGPHTAHDGDGWDEINTTGVVTLQVYAAKIDALSEKPGPRDNGLVSLIQPTGSLAIKVVGTKRANDAHDDQDRPVQIGFVDAGAAVQVVTAGQSPLPVAIDSTDSPLPVSLNPPQAISSGLGTIINANDVVSMAVAGTRWATVRAVVTGAAGTAKGTAQYSTDGQTNWVSAPYGKKLSTVAANPTVSNITAFTFATGDSWEFAIPGNTTHFRILCSNAGTVTQLTLTTFREYVPGCVCAVLYDVTSAVNTANNTGTIEAEGWDTIEHTFSMNGGVPAFSLSEVDDAGAALGNLVTSAAAFMGGLGDGATVGGAAGLVAAAAQVPLPKRVQYSSAAIAAQTTRVRIVARR